MCVHPHPQLRLWAVGKQQRKAGHTCERLKGRFSAGFAGLTFCVRMRSSKTQSDSASRGNPPYKEGGVLDTSHWMEAPGEEAGQAGGVMLPSWLGSVFGTLQNEKERPGLTGGRWPLRHQQERQWGDGDDHGYKLLGGGGCNPLNNQNQAIESLGLP